MDSDSRNPDEPSDPMKDGMYKLGVDTDVKLCVKTKGTEISLDAHKHVLADRSSVFEEFFKNNTSNTLIVHRVSPVGLDILLRYFYSDKLEAESPKQLIEVAKTARQFCVSGVVSACKDQLSKFSVNVNNVCSVLEAAVYLKNEQLKANCNKIVNEAPENGLFETQGFLTADKDVISVLLKHTTPCLDVMKGAFQWMHRNKAEHDRSLLKNIDLLELSCDDFLEIVRTFPTAFSYKEISCILSNMMCPGILELPPWCGAKPENVSRISSFEIIANRSMQMKTDCNKRFGKSYFYGEDGFEGSVIFEIKLSKCFPKHTLLEMLELAFGSNYVPEHILKLELFRFEQETRVKRSVKFSLQGTAEHYYLVLTEPLRLHAKLPFVFLLHLRVNGLKSWGVDSPISNKMYRAVQIPEDIFCNLRLSAVGWQSICVTLLSDWLVFLDPIRGEKKLVITSFYFDLPSKNT